MKHINSMAVVLLVATSSSVWAYGGGGGSSTKSCEKPKFSDFKPAANAEVQAGADFSFTASKNTYPDSIKVTVKDRSVATSTAKQPNGTFEVSGKLPSSVKGSYARIAINADAQSNCKGSGGWLIKVME